MEKKRKNTGVLLVCICIMILVIALIVYENMKSKGNQMQTETTLTTQSNNNNRVQEKQLPEGYLWGKSKVHIPKNKIEKNIISQITTYNLALFRGDFDNAIEYLYSDATEYFRPFYPEYYSDEDIIKEFYKSFTDSIFNLIKSYEKKGLELDFIVSDIKRIIEEDNAMLCVLDISVQTYYAEAKGEKYFHSIPSEDIVGISLDRGINWKFIDINEDTPNILRLRFSNDVISNIMNY